MISETGREGLWLGERKRGAGREGGRERLWLDGKNGEWE